MVNKILLLLILTFSVEAFGDLRHLINKRVDDATMTKFNRVVLLESPDEILEALVQNFPEVRVIVLDLEIIVEEVREDLIHFRDERVDFNEQQVYLEYTDSLIQSIGFHIAADVEMKSIPNRPLKNHPLLVLKNRAPRHAIIHEILHFINNRIPYEPFLNFPADHLLSEKLHLIYERAGEEVYVDSHLLKNPGFYKINGRDLCLRARYLNQNLQLLGYFLSELPMTSEIRLVEDHIRELTQVSVESRKILEQYKNQCGILSINQGAIYD